MFNITRHQVLFAAAILIGLLIGKLIKNFKIAIIIVIIIGGLIAIKWPKSNKRID